ncbi:hypothetical protein [Halobaculum gomorrense]|uniref:Uncharacterized protein n=1 Tax=Halobaculum gomorrense TaxID=43928 RepID=A0A1M5MLM6_9EURY|nr:hypothetical protein [Halobaculum gomorrense]SHG78280.1 hypothetical protein SAMN05443636_1060 [Halobaculum gomorrense]
MQINVSDRGALLLTLLAVAVVAIVVYPEATRSMIDAVLGVISA